MTRSAATQVASGTRTFIGGGQRNTASIEESVVCGGYGNSTTNYWSFVGGGYVNTASGEKGAVVGGRQNAASGIESFVGGGSLNVASGGGSVVAGGGDNNITATNNTASGQYAAILGGIAGLADRYGIQSHASGSFAAQGDAQRIRAVLRNKTTNATATELFLNGSTLRLTVPSGKVMSGIINCTGVKSDGSAVAHYVREFSIKNVAGTTTLVGSNTIGTDTEDNASTDISVTANDTNDAINISVTGIASETWRWVASVDAVEVAYGT
jgi:hypothetical protein